MAWGDYKALIMTNRAVDCFIRNGVICVNQCPLIKGINDGPEILTEMFRKLSIIGCPPYYLCQGRPTEGNQPYEVPIVRGWQIFSEAIQRGSGLGRRARFAISHETGKIEILAVDDKRIYLRYHRAKDPALRGQFMIYNRNDEAYGLDRLEPAEVLGSPQVPTESPLRRPGRPGIASRCAVAV